MKLLNTGYEQIPVVAGRGRSRQHWGEEMCGLTRRAAVVVSRQSLELGVLLLGQRYGDADILLRSGEFLRHFAALRRMRTVSSLSFNLGRGVEEVHLDHGRRLGVVLQPQGLPGHVVEDLEIFPVLRGLDIGSFAELFLSELGYT